MSLTTATVTMAGAPQSPAKSRADVCAGYSAREGFDLTLFLLSIGPAWDAICAGFSRRERIRRTLRRIYRDLGHPLRGYHRHIAANRVLRLSPVGPD